MNKATEWERKIEKAINDLSEAEVLGVGLQPQDLLKRIYSKAKSMEHEFPEGLRKQQSAEDIERMPREEFGAMREDALRGRIGSVSPDPRERMDPRMQRR